MKIFFFTAVFIFITIATIAQGKINFSSQNYAGLLEGENGSKFQLQTINGFKYKTWFAGIGTGIDWYYRRTIPLFASLNKDFLKTGKRNFYLSADGGINFPWKNDMYSIEGGYNIEKLNPGFYWAAGFGYKTGIGKNGDALLMQIGYSYKHFSETVKSRYIVYDSEAYPIERFDYYLKRLSLKLGWSF
jgi:hypothetical protein